MANRKPDIRKLAQRQRWMIWLILVSILTQCSPMFMVPGSVTLVAPGSLVFVLLTALQMAIYVCMIVGVVLMLAARGAHVLLIGLCGILMIAPCINLMVLLLVNMSATRTLRRAGIRVGLMGADPEEVERMVNPDLCNECGYNLTGNVSGHCPECGAVVPA
jgi:hypothetical protein